MTIFLGIIQFIIIALICIYELCKKSTSVFLWAVLLIMFGFPHMISIIFNKYDYSESTMNEASLFVILFSIIYLSIRYLYYRYFYKPKKTEKEDKNKEIKIEKKFLIVLFIILICIVTLRILELARVAGGISDITWATMRSTDDGYFSFAQIFIPVFFASSSCIILSMRLKEKKIMICSIILVMIEVLISKNRIEILPILVGVIYNYILNIKKVDLRKIVVLGIIGVLTLYSIYGLRVFRHAGSIQNFIDKYNVRTFNTTVIDYFKNDDGELSLRNHMYYFIEKDNNFENFGKGHTYLRMLLVLVPTSWSFGIKPTDFAISMGKAILPDSTGFSTHPTLFGDAYANFGFYGFYIGIFWAIFAIVIDKLNINLSKTISLTISFVVSIFYIIQGRGSVYNAFAWCTYSIILLFIVYELVKNINKENIIKIYEKIIKKEGRMKNEN